MCFQRSGPASQDSSWGVDESTKEKIDEASSQKKFFLSIAWVLLLYLLIRRQGQIIIIFGY